MVPCVMQGAVGDTVSRIWSADDPNSFRETSFVQTLFFWVNQLLRHRAAGALDRLWGGLSG